MTAIIDECVGRIGTLGQSHGSSSPPVRNSTHQQERRREELLTRRRVVTASERLVAGGLPWSQVPHWLDLPLRTLGLWRHELDCTGSPHRLGRPVLRSAREQRNEVIHLLDEIGPHLGVPTPA